MPNFLENLRLKNIFGLPPGGMVGNDLPSQGGITGRMPKPPVFGDMSNPRQSPFEDISFGPTQANSFETQQAPVPEIDEEDNITRMMSELYTPESDAESRFSKMIDEFPQRNKPGMLRKIASIAAGMGGGPQAFDEAMYGGYNREVADWKTKIGPVREAATLEKQGNINERTAAYQTISQHLRNESDRAREALNNRKADIAQQRADVYSFKAKNPNMRFDFTGPTVMVADPISGKVTDTKIPTGSMTDLDRITLQQEGQKELEGQRQEGRESIEGIRQGAISERNWDIANIPNPDNPGQLISVRIHRDTGEVRPIELKGKTAGPISGKGTAARPETPTQERVRLENKINEVLARNPDWERYIDRETGQVMPVGTGTFGANLTKQLRDKIVAEVFGTAEPKMERSSGAPRPAARPSATGKKYRRNKTTGEVQVSNDGGKTWQPVNSQ